MNIKRKRLQELEYNCLFYASKAFEYSSDLDIKDDDYSKEFIYNEFIYSFEIYKRALGDNKENNNSYRYIKNTLKELSVILIESKYESFLKNYFSSSRYNQLLSKLEEETNLMLETEEETTGSRAVDYFLIYDRMNLICDNKIFKENNFTIDDLSDQLTKVFNKFSSLWGFYSLEIKAESKALLIPKNKYEYWRKYMALSTLDIDHTFSYYVKKQKQDHALFALFNNLIPKDLFTIDITKTVQLLRSLVHFNKFADQLFNNPKVQPSFATYSNTSNQTDLDFNELLNHLINQKINYMHPKGILNWIDIAESLDIDDKSKKELLIAIYLLFDEKDKAIELSK